MKTIRICPLCRWDMKDKRWYWIYECEYCQAMIDNHDL